jgi:hypothetical protein
VKICIEFPVFYITPSYGFRSVSTKYGIDQNSKIYCCRFFKFPISDIFWWKNNCNKYFRTTTGQSTFMETPYNFFILWAVLSLFSKDIISLYLWLMEVTVSCYSMYVGYNNKLKFGVDLADGWSITSSQNTLKEIFLFDHITRIIG